MAKLDPRSSTTPDPAPEKPSPATPVQVAQYIRFALEQLPGENGHHRFEQLCLHLARKRIYPNLVPSTGPVSAGGDQGADFESYSVGNVTNSDSPFFARVSHERVIFACSLEKNVSKKIKDDLRAASQLSDQFTKLVFFSIWDLPIGKRHNLQSFARQTFQMELEVFDARAISDLLADTEVYWIALQYLSIPSDLILATPKTGNEDYEKALKADIDPLHLTPSEFFLIKDAVRFATFSPDHQSDLPALLKKIRLFRRHPTPRIQRKAFYEEFVAALRGMEAVQGFQADLEQYLSAILSTNDPSELEDASFILTYAAGATVRGLLPVELSFVAAWKEKVLDRVDTLLAERPTLSGRNCALLFVKGYLTLLDWTEALTQEGDVQTQRSLAASRAVPIWRSMIKKARNAPMFPLERFGKLLSQLVGYIGDAQDFMKLVSETDSLLVVRVGKHKLAEQAFERSKSLLSAGRILDAIDELHAAHLHAFTKETANQYVHFCIFLAGMYSQVGLYCAAKCYALAAAFAALRLEDESLRSLAYRGLAEAASCDHAHGASLSYFLAAAAFVHVSDQYSMSGSEKIRQSEWARVDYYCLLLTRASALVGRELHEFLRQKILPTLGLDEIYDETAPMLEKAFDFHDLSKLAEKAISEGIMPPFSDVGVKRRLAWEQLGIRWFIDWPNDYETARVAESFISALQIFLVDMRNTELSLLPADVYVSIELHDDKFTIETRPDNEQVRLRVRLERAQSGRKDLRDHTQMVHAVGASVLKVVSALSHERFLQIYETHAREGLHAKLIPQVSYDRLFDEFYSPSFLHELQERTKGIELGLPGSTIRTNASLAGSLGTHPEYSSKQSRRAITRRYERIPKLLKYTLPRLLADNAFCRNVSTLKKKGWKDWHILLATANIRQNYVVHHKVDPSAPMQEYRTKAEAIAIREEEETDPAPPSSIFTAEEMERALTMSQMSTLKSMGFDCSQLTPNLKAIDRFLRRFNYWTDDVPHERFFPD
jgi:hypothetical protein